MMTMSRRALLGYGLAGMSLAATRTAGAAPFVNSSGLQRGQFIWQPRLAAEGHITVLVAARQQMLHVYRGSAEIGFAPIRVPPSGQRPQLAVFALDDLRRDRRARDPRLVWNATLVHSDRNDLARSHQPLVLLPDEFAHLLFAASASGATVVMSEERSLVRHVATTGVPLLAGCAPAAVDAARGDLLARAQRTVETADTMGQQAAVVVTLRDGIASLVRQGRVERRARLRPLSGPIPSGNHVYTLIGPQEGPDTPPAAVPPADSRLIWQAVGVGSSAQARHIVEDLDVGLLDRIAIADPREALAMVGELGRGALLYITDGASNGGSRDVRSAFEVMANREAPAAVAETPPRAPVRSARVARPTRTVELPETSPPAIEGGVSLAVELFQTGR